MHKPESILENKIHKILCDFEIEMGHQKTSPGINLQEEKTCQ